MKRSKIILICLLLIPLISIAQEEKEIWDYPIKPGTEQWEALASRKEVMEVCRIPQEVLETVSTKDLAEICMNYPLFSDYMFFNSERVGVWAMIKGFNGLDELSKRKDGAQELVKIYKTYPFFTQISDRTSKDFRIIQYKLSFLELILSDEIFIDQLDNDQLKELGIIVLDKYENKLNDMNVFGLYNIKKTLLLGAIILDKRNDSAKTTEQQNIIKNFIEYYNQAKPETITEMSKLMSEL